MVDVQGHLLYNVQQEGYPQGFRRRPWFRQLSEKFCIVWLCGLLVGLSVNINFTTPN
jgi:hypothetical protein